MLAPINLSERYEHELRFAMSAEEFLAWDQADVHAEWVDGEVTIFMPASLRHQLIVNLLSTLIGLYARLMNLGTVLTAPYSMRAIDNGPVREPDLLYVAPDHRDRIKAMFLEGPADLVIEVISDTSVTRDRADKFYEYQEAGVREYLIIDSRPGKQRVDYYGLDESGSYRAIVEDEQGRFHSRVINDFWFRGEWLFQEKEPDALTLLGEIRGLSGTEIETIKKVLGGRTPNA